MAFSLDAFTENPTRELLDTCRKEDLLAICRHFHIEVLTGSKKGEIKKALEVSLIQQGILEEGSETKSEGEEGLEKFKIKLELERMKMAQEKMRLEFQEREKEREAQTAIRLKELALEEARIQSSQMNTSNDFDLARNSRLVPPFNEKEVTEYFTLFERVADTLKWPEEFRPLLLQSVLVGKAQSVYASLSVATT